MLQSYLDDKFSEIRGKFKENKEDHVDMKEEQKKTNGSIINLKIWKGGLTVGITLCALVVGYILNDYVELRDKSIRLEGKVTNMEKIIDDNFEVIQ